MGSLKRHGPFILSIVLLAVATSWVTSRIAGQVTKEKNPPIRTRYTPSNAWQRITIRPAHPRAEGKIEFDAEIETWYGSRMGVIGGGKSGARPKWPAFSQAFVRLEVFASPDDQQEDPLIRREFRPFNIPAGRFVKTMPFSFKMLPAKQPYGVSVKLISTHESTYRFPDGTSVTKQRVLDEQFFHARVDRRKRGASDKGDSDPTPVEDSSKAANTSH